MSYLKKLKPFILVFVLEASVSEAVVPILTAQQLRFGRTLVPAGGTNGGLEIRYYGKKPVFIKFLPKDLVGQSQRIAELYGQLSNLNVTPQFYGLFVDPRGTALVMDFIEIGLETQFFWKRPRSFRISRKVLNRMEEIARNLDSEGFKTLDSVQFIITKDGQNVYLVDPDLLNSRGNNIRAEVKTLVELLRSRFTIVD